MLFSETRIPLRGGWRLQSACMLQANGNVIAMPGFPVANWIETSVPSTVLAAQVAGGVLPDPYYGDNLRKLPGASYAIGSFFAKQPMLPDSPYRCGWWYRTEFTAPEFIKPEHFWLHFGGINYRADLWLNGRKIADAADVAGAYRTYDFDVTSAIEPGKRNVLAVETFPPTEMDLGINWVDWNPAPPDKDMGLWGGVDLIATGAVALRAPMVVTHFEDDTFNVADLTISRRAAKRSGWTCEG